jgi:multisubunit Na+/H+ antiporter MnhB subunit
MIGRRAARALVAVGVSCVSIALFAAILATPPAEGPGALARASMPETGVTNPVTAVLLDYRGYDTLLELAIVTLALVGSGALAPARAAPSPLATPVAGAAAALLAPAIIMVAGYLLWSGTSKPGGAFQAGAVLAGGLVLLEATTPTRPVWRLGAALRWGAAAGAGAFLLAGLAALAASGRFLDYPGPQAAYAMILTIEAVATVSIGICLSALLAAEPDPLRPDASAGDDGAAPR